MGYGPIILLVQKTVPPGHCSLFVMPYGWPRLNKHPHSASTTLLSSYPPLQAHVCAPTGEQLSGKVVLPLHSNGREEQVPTLTSTTALPLPYNCLAAMVRDSQYYNPASLSTAQTSQAYSAYCASGASLPFDYVTYLSAKQDQDRVILTLNSYYFFVPLVFLMSTVLFIYAYTNHISTAARIFFYILTVLLIYGASIIYRTQVLRMYQLTHRTEIAGAQTAHQSFVDSVGLIPVGLARASCAIVNIN